MRRARFNNNTLPALLDDLFSDIQVNNSIFNPSIKFKPPVNIKEDDNGFSLEVMVPGLTKKDIKVDLDNDLLTISAEIKAEEKTEKENYKMKEFSHASFKRSFTLPESANGEQIEASFKNGILNISIPKKEEAKPKPAKTIKIS